MFNKVELEFLLNNEYYCQKIFNRFLHLDNGNLWNEKVSNFFHIIIEGIFLLKNEFNINVDIPFILNFSDLNNIISLNSHLTKTQNNNFQLADYVRYNYNTYTEKSLTQNDHIQHSYIFEEILELFFESNSPFVPENIQSLISKNILQKNISLF